MGLFSRKHYITGVFEYHDDLPKAVQALMRDRFAIDRVYSPVPEEEIYHQIGLKRSPVRFIALIGAITGGIVALLIAVYSATRWGFIIQGKPVLGWPSFSLVAYEWTLIWAAICTFLAVVLLGRMPWFVGKDHNPEFSDDRFGLRIVCRAAAREQARELLRRHGAIEVYEENP